MTRHKNYYEKTDIPFSVMNEKRYEEEFLCDSKNNLAYEAAMKVIDLDQPFLVTEEGDEANGMVLIGNSGCGKTHLAYIIYKTVCERYSEKEIAMIDCEALVDTYIQMKYKADHFFEKTVAEVDFLIIDGTECLRGKAATCEMIYHIMEECIARGTRVVLTASRVNYYFVNGLKRRVPGFLCLEIDYPALDSKMRYVEKKYGRNSLLPERVVREFCRTCNTFSQLDGMIRTYLFQMKILYEDSSNFTERQRRQVVLDIIIKYGKKVY